MSIPFLTRAPTQQEQDLLRLAVSTFSDGGGMIREGAGGSLPGWRDFERAVAEVLKGKASESKAIFDVVVPSDTPRVDYGLSLKSKELDRPSAIGDLERDGRVYMELSNSPAKFWRALGAKGITEEDFRNQRRAEDVGAIVLDTVEGWHQAAANGHQAATGRELHLGRSAFVVLSYSSARAGARDYQWHSFDLAFPRGIVWQYRSAKSLKGFDPAHPREVLVDWYGLSGGQLKYYPRASSARQKSAVFKLLQAPKLSILAKAARYWPEEFRKAGGTHAMTTADVANEIGALIFCAGNAEAKKILEDAYEQIKKIR
jgi:hypothetical protein